MRIKDEIFCFAMVWWIPATPASNTQSIGCPSIMAPSKMGTTKNLIFYFLIRIFVFLLIPCVQFSLSRDILFSVNGCTFWCLKLAVFFILPVFRDPILSTLCLLFVFEEEELYLLETLVIYFNDFVFLLFCGIICVAVF